jgi:hypothetical protein
VPGDLGDPLLTTLILWWNTQQVPFTASWWNGPFFFPGTETLALSDHRVGLGVFATPLMWLGASPLTAYGITFLLTWWLSAGAAYALGWTLTGNRAAAFVAGLIYGFNPFRAGHLSHLELLASYCLPLILLALHRWLVTRRRRWLIALSAALLLQGLTSGYYLLFMLILVTLWLIWFARNLARREYTALLIALVAPLVVLAPVLRHYRQVHAAMGLARSPEEIKRFSADLVGLLTAPEPIALWTAPAAWHRPEGDIMPGLVAVLIVIAAAAIARRQSSAIPGLAAWLRRGLLAIALTEIVVAALPAITGPLAFTLAGIDVSMSGIDKPLSVAFVCAAAWVLTSVPVVAAFRARSAFAFYLLATVAMFVLALGPEGRLLGRPVLYKAPYSWLMWLPGFEHSFRAPARFAMLAVLALSAAAAVALIRLAPRVPRRARAAAVGAIAAAILAESWIFPLPLAAAPAPFALPPGVPDSAAVLEVPVGVFEDALAMFHTTVHHRRTVNGMSGYVPPHFQILSLSLNEGNEAGLAVLRRYADLVVVRNRNGGHATIQVLEKQMMPPRPAMPPVALIRPADIARKGTEMVTLTLAEPRMIAGVELAYGPYFGAFARSVEISVSTDGHHWQSLCTVDGSIPAIEGALRDPRRVPMVIRFEPHFANRIRIRHTVEARADWTIAEPGILVRPVE